jgi:hypothetical protein
MGSPLSTNKKAPQIRHLFNLWLVERNPLQTPAVAADAGFNFKGFGSQISHVTGEA